MKASLRNKLDNLVGKCNALSEQLNSSSLVKDQNLFQKVSKEYAGMQPIVSAYQSFQDCEHSIAETQAMLTEAKNDADAHMQQYVENELSQLQAKQLEIFQNIQRLLISKDPDDNRNIYLEIRAGTGGDEASLFVADLYKMYMNYTLAKQWKFKVLSVHGTDQGGYREIIASVKGKEVYANLKFESGTHRVQRVPATESQGRVHTSACTVAVLAAVEEIDEIDINPQDLRIDTFRSSGAGGQHVNTTDSAVRITHIPTGVVVECQDERSQHKNKARAMSLLQSRILAEQRQQQQSKQAATRRSLVGSGDRSERIRTYNFPQGRVTDHRVGLTLYKLEAILAGEGLQEVVNVLIQESEAERLAEVDSDKE